MPGDGAGERRLPPATPPPHTHTQRHDTFSKQGFHPDHPRLRSEYITWGPVSRKNVMYNGQPGENNPDTSSPVGSSKAFVVQIKTA